MIGWLQLHPHVWKFGVIIAALLILGVILALLVRWFVRYQEARLDDVEWDEEWRREPSTLEDAADMTATWHTDLPGPSIHALNGEQVWRAGEPHILDSSTWPVAHLEPWHERGWWDDPDLTVWDAKQQAARCWEILHIEFPRLRAELGIAA